MKSVAGVGGLNLASRFIGLFTSIVLARELGSVGYGYYSFSISVVSMLALLAPLGLPQILTREISKNIATENWATINGLKYWCRVLFMFGASAAMLIAIIILWISDDIQSIDYEVFAIASLLIPVLTWTSIQSSILQGLRYSVHATWPIAILRPMLLLAFIFGASYSNRVSAEAAVALNLAAAVLTFIALSVLLSIFWPKSPAMHSCDRDGKKWVTSLIPFFAISAINLINQRVDILFVGAMLSPEEVGVYNVASQGAQLVTVVFLAVSAVIAPQISGYFHEGNKAELARLYRRSFLIIAGATIPISATMMFAGEDLLSFFFGNSFSAGANSLFILSIGQLAQAMFGLAGLFLSMTGNERDPLKALVVCLAINIVLNNFLVPTFGINGAAAATSVSVIVYAIILNLFLFQRLRLTIFYCFSSGCWRGHL